MWCVCVCVCVRARTHSHVFVCESEVVFGTLSSAVDGTLDAAPFKSFANSAHSLNMPYSIQHVACSIESRCMYM
jgi:hypothetical protein